MFIYAIALNGGYVSTYLFMVLLGRIIFTLYKNKNNKMDSKIFFFSTWISFDNC